MWTAVTKAVIPTSQDSPRRILISTSLLLILLALTCFSVGFVIAKLWGDTKPQSPLEAPAQNREEIQRLTEVIALKSKEAADWQSAYESTKQSYSAMKEAYESMSQAAQSYERAAESNRQAYEDMKAANESLRAVINGQS